MDTENCAVFRIAAFSTGAVTGCHLMLPVQGYSADMVHAANDSVAVFIDKVKETAPPQQKEEKQEVKKSAQVVQLKRR